MKRYVFLTRSIRNVGGAQLYISRKVDWLKKQGWGVGVYFYDNGEIVIDNLKPYQGCYLPELEIPFELQLISKKQKILDVVCPDDYDKLIIESHLLHLCLWGEYIAYNRKGMNVCYLLSESFPKVASQMRRFLEFKLEHNLLYGIKDQSIPSLLGDSPATSNRGLPAVGCSDNNVFDCDYILPFSLDNKVNILSIGRMDKPYVQPMIRSVKSFVSHHRDIDFNLVFIGDAADEKVRESILDSVNEEENVTSYCTGYINPIPRSLIAKMNVAIACAGCVVVAKNEGILTISIDAKDHMAIGIAGITTNNTVFRTNEPKLKIEDLLEDIIIDKKYHSEEIVKNNNIGIDYSKHKLIIDNYNNEDYFNVNKWPLSIKQKFIKCLIPLMGHHRLNHLYHILKSRSCC